MVRRHAVGKAVGAAGVLRDVAADGAHPLAGRVGGIVEPVLRDGFGKLNIDESRLDYRKLVLGVDLEDIRHAGERNHDAAQLCDCAAAEAGARTSRDYRLVVSPGDLDDP